VVETREDTNTIVTTQPALASIRKGLKRFASIADRWRVQNRTGDALRCKGGQYIAVNNQNRCRSPSVCWKRRNRFSRVIWKEYLSAQRLATVGLRWQKPQSAFRLLPASRSQPHLSCSEAKSLSRSVVATPVQCQDLRQELTSGVSAPPIHRDRLVTGAEPLKFLITTQAPAYPACPCPI